VLLQRAYEQALEPKKLVTIDGGHFEAYLGAVRGDAQRRRVLVSSASDRGL
jgi:hypothetical protein